MAQYKESANVEDTGLTPDPGRSPRDGNGNPLQYSCLENPMDREGWQATVHGGREESDISRRLNTHSHYKETTLRFCISDTEYCNSRSVNHSLHPSH